MAHRPGVFCTGSAAQTGLDRPSQAVVGLRTRLRRHRLSLLEKVLRMRRLSSYCIGPTALRPVRRASAPEADEAADPGIELVTQPTCAAGNLSRSPSMRRRSSGKDKGCVLSHDCASECCKHAPCQSAAAVIGPNFSAVVATADARASCCMDF
jgi:hypothetical protein